MNGNVAIHCTPVARDVVLVGQAEPWFTHAVATAYERSGLNQSINWYMYHFWRGVFVQHKWRNSAKRCRVPTHADGASFNMKAVKEQI
jgi:hypothetical protein